MGRPTTRNAKVHRTQQYVTHGGLPYLAKGSRCAVAHVNHVLSLCQRVKDFRIFKATVHKSARCRGFVGSADAHPCNVPPDIINRAQMRMAATSAANPALLKAEGTAFRSIEELPPWGLAPEQIPVLRRTLQSHSSFPKGGAHAH